ncbi:hypothetical protein IJ380_01255 [Candidatus Saccharibacteria bacterium]|nr:hypothetical protein [Candidatus Saccharibacteria bacterium]
MSKFVPEYEDETLSPLWFSLFVLFILGGVFSLIGLVRKVLSSGGTEWNYILWLIILIVFLPMFIWVLFSRIRNFFSNRKNRKLILEKGTKFPGTVEKIITKKDREYDKTFMKSTVFFELDTNTYLLVRLGEAQNFLELQTPPVLTSHLPEISEEVEVYLLNGFYYVHNPRLK